MCTPAKFLILIFLVLSAAAVSAEDWSRFRGPNGQGVLANGELPPSLLPEAASWRVPTPPGHSSPVLAGERIYLTASDQDHLWTIALDRASGREVWRRRAPRDRNEKLDQRNGPAAGSPAVDAAGLVVFFGDYGLIAYDHHGTEQWRHPLGPFNNLYGMGSSPVLWGNLVLYAADQHGGSFLIAVDRSSGRTVWRTERPEAKTGHSTPALYDAGGGQPQVVLPGSFFLTSYDIATGERLWWVRGLSFEMKSVPVLEKGMLFINGYGSEFNDPDQSASIAEWSAALSQDRNGDGLLGPDELQGELEKDWLPFNDFDGDGKLARAEWQYFRDALATRNNLMAIRLPDAEARGDLTESHRVWQYFRNVAQLPSAVVAGDLLYMISDRGIVTIFRAESGDLVVRGRIEGLVDSIYASPVVAGDRILFAGRSGKIAVLPTDGTLVPIAVTDFEEELVATPALADGELILRTQAATYAFGDNSGKETGQVP